MRVLITVLDWGLGHATRCIPVVRELQRRSCTVSIAGNGDSLALLKREFPGLAYFELPAYDPVYSSRGSLAIKMALQIPKFLKAIKQEHRVVQSLIQTENFNLIISDNRYGCWSESVPSIFLSHQLNIQIPRELKWLSKPLNRIHTGLVNKFSACWIPDYPDAENNLSGDLSRIDETLSTPVVHIGPLPRFEYMNERTTEYDIVCILSGPEPQRSIFEEMVVSQLESSALRYIVVRGVVTKVPGAIPNTVGFLNSEDLQDVISKSSVVIARSGYSTIMDLVALRKRAIVVPTPGQTEQEYLAKRWSERGILQGMSQEDFDLEAAMNALERFIGFGESDKASSQLLINELDRLLKDKSHSLSIST